MFVDEKNHQKLCNEEQSQLNLNLAHCSRTSWTVILLAVSSSPKQIGEFEVWCVQREANG